MINESSMFRLKRIRLVNFHNIQDETIEVSGGGHLFLLGDNGSGKTTVLDAVHYVLTGGGNLMEFNSAARMGGSRQDGRRVQGIVLRYNVDTGPMNPAGGVSYAALELIDDSNNILTIGVGLSAFSLEERIQRWGIILSAPLENIPWLTEEEGRFRVTQQKEMREALLPKGAFYTIGAYEKELARRVFNDDEIFAETCRFLSMGKAYREIATSAADYHQLFKTLLPEPKTDLFDRIIDSLKTLDEATTLLEDLEKKLQYLTALEEQVKIIRVQREGIARYGWLKIYFERNNIDERIHDIDNEQEQIRMLLAVTSKQIALYRDQQIALQRRIDDLRSADSAGLVRQEKELSQDIISRNQQLKSLKQALNDASEVVKAADKKCTGLQIELATKIDQTSKAIAGASTLEPQLSTERIEQLQRMAVSEQVADEIKIFTIDDLTIRLDEHIRGFQREQDRLSEKHKMYMTEHEFHVNEREKLLSADSLRPNIAGINEALAVLNDSGIDCQLLYEQLEWNEELDTTARSSMEECIGIDVLSIFGTTRYRLELQKEERFAPFIEAVRKFNPFSTGSEETLRQFIDDHRDEIINSEIENVPPVLDYRNWYTYHLRMFTANDEGIIIDRRTKSVGSGGEQAVPNYLTILTIAHFLFKGNGIRLSTLLFDETFYGIDAGRRDQLLGFASDIGLQLLVASPDQDGVRKEVPRSTTLLVVVKDSQYDVHLYPFHWENPTDKQVDLFDDPAKENIVAAFGEELGAVTTESEIP